MTAAPFGIGDGEGHGDGWALSLPPENLLAGQPYLLLLRCLSMSQRRLKAFPHEGQRWVPRWMWRWCCSEPGMPGKCRLKLAYLDPT